MSMLDELLRQLQEAAEQQRTQPLPGTPRPAATMRKVAKRVAAAVAPPPVEVGEDPVLRLVADSMPAVVESSRRREHPLMARLRQHGGMRDAVILAEILRRPGRR